MMGFEETGWSDEAITFKEAKKTGVKLGEFLERKNGFGPDFWTMEVYEIDGHLYGGVEYMGWLEPMREEMRKEIMEAIKDNA